MLSFPYFDLFPSYCREAMSLINSNLEMFYSIFRIDTNKQLSLVKTTFPNDISISDYNDIDPSVFSNPLNILYFANIIPDYISFRSRTINYIDNSCCFLLIHVFKKPFVNNIILKNSTTPLLLPKYLHHPRSLEEALIFALLEEWRECQFTGVPQCMPFTDIGIFAAKEFINLSILPRVSKVLMSGGNDIEMTQFGRYLGMNCHDFFDQINIIASQAYESRKAKGRIILARSDHGKIIKTITIIDRAKKQMESYFQINNINLARKLLEISNDEQGLLSEAGFIYGVGKIDSSYDEKEEDIFTINILYQNNWEVTHGPQTIFNVKNRRPYAPTAAEQFSEEKFIHSMQQNFTINNIQQINDLWLVCKEAIQFIKGGIIVISPDAQELINRLPNQAIPIEPQIIDPKIIQSLSKIDGAILIGTNCKCYGFGAILDGDANEKCSIDRGSRYNSSIKFLYSRCRDKPCVIIVASEDGDIKLLSSQEGQSSNKE